MTSIDIKGIQERESKATPGPWRTGAHPEYEEERCVTGPGGYIIADAAMYPSDHADDDQHLRNAEFIAHARSDIPALLDEVRRLRRMLATATGV